MQLTLFTDYALRVLIHLRRTDGAPVTVRELSEQFGVSRNHLVKVVHSLGRCGLVVNTPGRGGGIRLAVLARETPIGEIIRATEPERPLVECVDPASGGHCSERAYCRLRDHLDAAVGAFYGHLDALYLDDLIDFRVPPGGDPIGPDRAATR